MNINIQLIRMTLSFVIICSLIIKLLGEVEPLDI